MKIVLFLLLALPLFGKQSERYNQEKFAREIGGQVEVVMKDGTRCDILTATHAIEVDFAIKLAGSDWTEFTLRSTQVYSDSNPKSSDAQSQSEKGISPLSPDALTQKLTHFSGKGRQMLTQIVKRWGSLSDEMKRAVLRVLG